MIDDQSFTQDDAVEFSKSLRVLVQKDTKDMRERLENTKDIEVVRSIHDQVISTENYLSRIQLSLPVFTELAELREVFEIKKRTDKEDFGYISCCEVNIRAVSVLV